jgi:dsRNA-specific ribonuclease
MNAKNDLQELLQKNKMPLPNYICIEDDKTDPKNRVFQATITVNNKTYTGGWKKTKKDAEKDVAELTLDSLRIVDKKREQNVFQQVVTWKQIGYYKVLDLLGIKDTYPTRYYMTNAFLHPAYYRERLERNLQIFDDFMKLGSDIPNQMQTHVGLSTLGDSIMKCQQTVYFYKLKFDNGEVPTPEFITKSRRNVENREYLKKKMLGLGVHQYIMYIGEKDLEDTNIPGEFLEAIIGSLYLIGGNDLVLKVMTKLKLFE